MACLKSVIFDMDGVLVNTEPVHLKMYQRLLADYGKEMEYAVYAPCIGSTTRLLQKLLMDAYGVDIFTPENQRRIARYEREILDRDGYGEIPGMASFIKNLKESGLRLAVASSSPYSMIVRTVRDIGLEPYFDRLVSGEDVPQPKPAPDVFQKAMEELGVRPEECVIVEDSANGVRAAKAAGAACIGFSNPDSGSQDLGLADILVEGFEELDRRFVEKVHCRACGLPVTVYEGERFRLREIRMEDLPQLKELCAQRQGEAGWGSFLAAEDESAFLESYIRHMYPFYDFGMYVLEREGRILGLAGLDVEPGMSGGRETPGGQRRAARQGLPEGQGFQESQETPGGQEAQVTLGYLIAPGERGKGYAGEACTAILQYAGERLGLQDILIRVREDNLPSLRTARKLAERFAGLARLEVEPAASSLAK